MSITVRCIHCSVRLNVKDQFAGKLIRCPKCKGDVTVPQAEDDNVEPARPAFSRKPAEAPPDFDEDEDERPRRRTPPIAQPPSPFKRKIVIALWTVGGIFLAALVGLGAFGFYMHHTDEAAKKEAIAYNETMTNAFKRADDGRTKLVGHITSYLLSRNANPNEIRIIPLPKAGADDVFNIRLAYRTLEATRMEIRNEIPNWKVPSRARKLHEKYEQFFEAEQASMKKFGQVVGIIENEGLQPKEKSDRAFRLLDEIDNVEQPLLAELQKVQTEFAHAHGLRLQHPPVRVGF